MAEVSLHTPVKVIRYQAGIDEYTVRDLSRGLAAKQITVLRGQTDRSEDHVDIQMENELGHKFSVKIPMGTVSVIAGFAKDYIIRRTHANDPEE